MTKNLPKLIPIFPDYIWFGVELTNKNPLKIKFDEVSHKSSPQLHPYFISVRVTIQNFLRSVIELTRTSLKSQIFHYRIIHALK